MELRLPLEMSPGREAACRAVFGTWGFFPNDARKNFLLYLKDFLNKIYASVDFVNPVVRLFHLLSTALSSPLD